MSEGISDEPQAVVIETNTVSVRMSGPGATPDAALQLWRRVMAHTAIRKASNVSAGGIGFNVELDPGRY